MGEGKEFSRHLRSDMGTELPQMRKSARPSPDRQVRGDGVERQREEEGAPTAGESALQALAPQAQTHKHTSQRFQTLR